LGFADFFGVVFLVVGIRFKKISNVRLSELSRKAVRDAPIGAMWLVILRHSIELNIQIDQHAEVPNDNKNLPRKTKTTEFSA